MIKISWTFPVLLCAACGGGGSGGPGPIGVAGGTITSADGRMKLVIPPGALSTPAQLSLSAKSSGFTADPELLAGSTYSLDAPTVSLAVPAQLSYTIPPATAAAGLHPASTGASYGDCELTNPVCFVILGTGSCAPDHPKFLQLELNCGVGNDCEWVIDCGLPDPPVPELTFLDPSSLLGGLFDPSTHQVTAPISALLPSTLGLLLDTNTLTISSDETTVHVSDTFHLTAVQTGNATIGKVVYYDIGGYSVDANGNKAFFSANTVVGQSTTPPYSVAVQEAGLLPGHRLFTARAYADANDTDVNDDLASDNLDLTIVADGVASPVVATLSASASSVTAAGSVTLTATATGGSGTIAKVELFEGATKLGEVDTSPYTFDIAYTAANNGNHTYFVTATDSASAAANSNNVTVNVAIITAPAYDYYVDPVGGSDSNPGTMASPFKSLTHLATKAVSGQSIGLLDGNYLEGATLGTCDGRNIVVPGGLTFTSINPRGAVIANITFKVTSGSLSVVDVMVDGGTNGGCTGIASSSTDAGATLTLSGVKFADLGHIVLAGSVKASVSPGSVSGSMVDGTGVFATLTNSAELAIHGGLLDRGANTVQCEGSLFSLDTTSKLTLDGVTVQNIPGNVISAAQNTTVALTNNTLLNHVAYASGCGSVVLLNADGNGTSQATLTMDGSTISNSVGAAIGLRTGTLATVSLSASTLTQNGSGILFNQSEGSPLNLSVVNSHITQNTQIGLSILPSGNQAINATITGSTFTGNALGMSFYTGAGSSITLSGNTIQNTGTGVTLDGTTAITATAHGNTWTAGAQSANGSGLYTDGTLVTHASGSGTNYNVVNGSTLDL